MMVSSTVANPAAVTTTAAVTTVEVEAADTFRDVGNEGYAQEHTSAINIINNINNDTSINNDNGNQGTPPVSTSPIVPLNTEDTATHILLHRQIQYLQADLHNKEEVCFSSLFSFVFLNPIAHAYLILVAFFPSHSHDLILLLTPFADLFDCVDLFIFRVHR